MCSAGGDCSLRSGSRALGLVLTSFCRGGGRPTACTPAGAAGSEATPARAAKAQAEAHASSDVDCSELPRPFWVCCCVKGDLSANLQRVAIFNGTAVTEEMIAVVSFDETKIAVDGSAAATATAALPRAHDADLVGGATTCFDSALSRAGTSGHQSRSSLPGHNTNPAELVNF